MKKIFIWFAAGLIGLMLLPGSAPAQAITQAYPPEYRTDGVEVIYLDDFIDQAGDLVEAIGEEAFTEFEKSGSKWNDGGADIYVIQATKGDADEGAFIVAPDSQFIKSGSIDMNTVNALPYLKIIRGRKEEKRVYFYVPDSDLGRASAYKMVKAPSGKSYLLVSSRKGRDYQQMFVELLVNTAAEMIEEQGKKAFLLIRKQDSIFRFKDTYVFVLTDKGVPVVDPATPQYEGINMIKEHPEKARLYQDIIKAANSDKDGGWVRYRWSKPGGTEPADKASFVKLIDSRDGKFIVGSGVYLEN